MNLVRRWATFRAVFVLICVTATPLANAQVSVFCNNLFSPNAPNQPAAHYVGDAITLQVDRQSNFNFIYGTSNTSLGQGFAKTVIAAGPGPATMVAQTIPGTAWGNCQLDTNIFRDVDAQISSITGDFFTASDLSFNGISSGGAGGNSYLWIFGDGETSTERRPVHSYNSAGTFTVQFRVTDSNGRSESDSQSITISDNPNVPGRPTLIIAEFAGCNGASATYTLDWNATGTQPSNYFAYEFKPSTTALFYPIQWLNTNTKIEYGLTPSLAYEVRVRGCLAASEATCGPSRSRTFTAASCGGGPGGGRHDF